MVATPSQYGQPWTRDELILAFDLYCRIPFKATKASNPKVIELAQLLNRSAAAVARKLGNFGAFDPALRKQRIVGLTHTAKLDREIWNEFHRDWAGLVEHAARLRVRLGVRSTQDDLGRHFDRLRGPSERTALTRQRLHQAFFREAVLSSYNNSCCVTGLSVSEALIASHIIPWSTDVGRRADPRNGLCLSATFDRLFDAGLLTIERDLTIRVSQILRSRTDKATGTLILRYHGRAVRRPCRFTPSEECLDWHRQNVFRG